MNLTSEGEDAPVFVCVWTEYREPLVKGAGQEKMWCTEKGESVTSDAEACQIAYRNALECVIDGDLIGNDPYTITVTCP